MKAKPTSFFDRLVNSVIAKLGIMFILVLILLIPLSWVMDLIGERRLRHEQVGEEIAMKWGWQQVINGPVMAIPVEERQTRAVLAEDGTREQLTDIRRDWIILLPEEARISGSVSPEILKRGIYESVVYLADLRVAGHFGALDLGKLSLENSTVKWDEAKLVFGISDLKGLSASPMLSWKDKQVALFTNADQSLSLFEQNLVADIVVDSENVSGTPFDIQLQLRGSKSLNFLPLASQTRIDLDGKWSSPSFNGAFLPDQRTVGDTAFAAQWNIPGFSRKQPQQWRGEAAQLYTFAGVPLNADAAFDHDFPVRANERHPRIGASLASDEDMVQINFLPEATHYQKTTRVAKYGILVVLLTFASLFFAEMRNKRRIHLVQYVLIGAAMVMFYSLLLAISEHVGFDWAYGIASLATIGVIASFVKAITRHVQAALALAAVLALSYGFIYVLLQLKDFSLLVGTAGVFAMLVALMYFSTQINWHRFEERGSRLPSTP